MWIDIAVALILIIFIFRGDKRGLIASLIGIIGWAVSLIAAFVGYPYMVNFLDDHTGIRESVTEHVNSYVKEEAMERLQGTSSGSLPDSVLSAIRSTSNSALDQQINELSRPVVNIIMNVIAIVLLIIIIGIIFKIIQLATRNLTGFKHGPIGVLNSVGGMLFGLVEGALLAYFLMIFLYYLSIFGGYTGLSNQLDNSMVMGIVKQLGMIPYGDYLSRIGDIVSRI